MGLSDILQSLSCCRHGALEEGDEKGREEKYAILSPCSSNHSKPICEGGAGEEHEGHQSSWGSATPTAPVFQPDSDSELQAFITLRNQVDKDTEEWEKLNYDIHTLKCTRREVSSRWKKILWQMGYQKEADALLAVNRQSLLTHVEDSPRARELLDELWQESGLFPQGYSTPDKYLLIMDRLVSLDSAEEFVELAKKKYPKN
ncbi:melanoregulin [Scleropages formosus]|uniref:melanoregulin n=1 Tax=Scleropages formosus TaxID=113540 RepID=UPI000878BFAD|nr:melanoregulin-like [Scleropages formosus]